MILDCLKQLILNLLAHLRVHLSADPLDGLLRARLGPGFLLGLLDLVHGFALELHRFAFEMTEHLMFLLIRVVQLFLRGRQLLQKVLTALDGVHDLLLDLHVEFLLLERHLLL